MTDIWASKHHSFLGISAHWIDDDLERRSRVLACQNFKNPHSGARIASNLQAVHDENRLTGEKLVSTSSDNARNMIKAFVDYGVNLNDDFDNESDDESEDESEAAAGEGAAADEDLEPELNRLLPAHQRCINFRLRDNSYSK